MKYVTVAPGLPENVRTEDDAYTLVDGETSFDHNPSNAELNSLYADPDTGRVATLNGLINSAEVQISINFGSLSDYIKCFSAMGDFSEVTAWDATTNPTYRATIASCTALLS